MSGVQTCALPIYLSTYDCLLSQLNETGFSDIKDIFFKYYDLNNITVRSNYKLAAKAETVRIKKTK